VDDKEQQKQAALDKAAADKLAAEQAAAQTEKPGAGKARMGKGVLTVTGPETGRRRAGHVFGKAPVEVDASTLTQNQVDAIMADPLLSVKASK
jgi:hypothetical protein